MEAVCPGGFYNFVYEKRITFPWGNKLGTS